MLKEKEANSFPKYTPNKNGFSVFEGDASIPFFKALKMGMFTFSFMLSSPPFLSLKSAVI